MGTSASNPSKGEAHVAKLSPLRESNAGILQYKYDAIRLLARRGSDIVQTVVDQHAKQLDRFLDQLEELLDQIRDGTKKQLSKKELDAAVLRLPVIMYRLVEGIDRAAIEADTAKAAHKLVAAANFDALAEGSIPDRKAKADVETADEAAIVDLAKHVYQRLRGKLEAADKLFDAIRKVMSSHDQEQKTFRSDANG